MNEQLWDGQIIARKALREVLSKNMPFAELVLDLSVRMKLGYLSVDDVLAISETVVASKK